MGTGPAENHEARCRLGSWLRKNVSERSKATSDWLASTLRRADWLFLRLRGLETLLKLPEVILSDLETPRQPAVQARIAARSGFTPVGKHVQRHLGGDLRQPLHQEVRRAHPHLERAERVLDRLAALTHGLRILVETPLHRLQYMLVLPAGDATLLARRAAVLDRAGAARIGPVA